MIAIIDYDAGNIRSVENALNSLGIENVVTSGGGGKAVSGHLPRPAAAL